MATLLNFLQLYCACVALMVVGVLFVSAESTLLVYFKRVPPPRCRSSNAVFQYLVERLDGSNACKRNTCSFSCELDGKVYPCQADGIVLTNLTLNHEHRFLLNVSTNKGERNSSVYSWFIDTIPPTAAITSEQTHTNGQRIAIDVTFSEPCTGIGGFHCLNSSNCDIMVAGPAQVDASSLQITRPGAKYSLGVIISSEVTYGRVVITMVENTCTDQAGNKFRRTNDSTLIIHFDRRPVMVDFWTSVPSYELKINGIPRTVVSTSKPEDLIIFLDFSIPTRNSTEQVLNALHVNSGILTPLHGRSNGTRGFSFKLKNISRTEIITIELQATSILGRTGTPVSPVAPITFLYDPMKPNVVLRTSSLTETRDFNINIIAEFTKPVFGFVTSIVDVSGGRLIRQVVKELSRAFYLLTVKAVTKEVSVTIPAGKVTDISGNENLASNQLAIKHYSTPAISIALHSFISAGTIATSLVAAMVSLSSANLEALSILALGGASSPASNPSINLHGMIGHLQVFALTSWFSTNQFIKYSETTRGLRWLIPHHKLPWKKIDTWSSILEREKLAGRSNGLSAGEHSYNRDQQQNDLMNLSYIDHKLSFQTKNTTKFGRFHNQHDLSKTSTLYGLPLNSIEYFTYFLRGEPLSASNVIKGMESYKGWQDMEMNLFWLGVGGSCLLLLHVFAIFFLRHRIGRPPQGSLSVPRFELFLLILMLPCLSQSSTFIIKGGTTGGIITGVLLLAIPVAFILSSLLFLVIAIYTGSFAQYKEFNKITNEEKWYTKLWFFFIGRPMNGKWFNKEGLPSSFLSRFGILFDNWKGPPVLILGDQNEQNNTITKWSESDKSGIRRTKTASSEDSNEETKISTFKRVFGCIRASYIILDLLRKVGLGIISAAYPSENSNKSLFALIITLMQFIFLFTTKPYISRGVHVVESVSLLCEAGVFVILILHNGSHSVESKTWELVMLFLLMFTFIAQITNQWYAMVNSLLNLSQSQNKSLRDGLKLAAKGLILPFLPSKHWSSVISTFSQTETDILSLNPICSGTEFERRNRNGYMDPISAMTATVVPVQSPSTPSHNVIERRDPRTWGAGASSHIEVEGKWLKGHNKAGLKKELKMLRELAKASFSGDTRVDEASTSYTLGEQQHSSGEIYLGNPKRRYY
ncbi:hypothetical protein glysoja_047182 [Glycine soja]|uniref:Bacterial Ig-like domain-containing protein n=1 Tax=Glycine soja TaxID=3848 RepID=A0A0B2PQI2_GLYSO|nr:hypothetical protein glysoja_047182 [Glycine soja]